MLDAQRIEIFLAVLQFGSISRAAMAMETTQSTISRQITDLESQCGGRLFHRNGRGMAATELGLQLTPRFRALKRDMNDLLLEAKGEAAEISGTVRVGLLPTVASAIARRIYLEVRRRYPHLTLCLLEGYSGQIHQWLEHNEVDFAVLYHYGRGAPLEQDVFAKVNAYIVGVRGDPLTAAPSVAFDALDGLPLVLPTAPSPLRSILEQTFKRRKLHFNAAVDAHSKSLQLELVASGGGYAIMPFFAVPRRVASGELQASALIQPNIDCSLTLAMSPTQHAPSRSVHEVARLVRQILQEMPASGIWRKPAIELTLHRDVPTE